MPISIYTPATIPIYPSIHPSIYISVVLRLECASESPGGLLIKTKIPLSHPQFLIQHIIDTV